MKQLTRRTLKVGRETLRRLDAQQLRRAGGGMHSDGMGKCSPSGFYICYSQDGCDTEVGCATDGSCQGYTACDCGVSLYC